MLRFHVKEKLQNTMVLDYALLLMKNVPLDTHQLKPMMLTLIVKLALLDTSMCLENVFLLDVQETIQKTMVKKFVFHLMHHVNLVMFPVIRQILNLIVLHALLDTCESLKSVQHFHIVAKVQFKKREREHVREFFVLILFQNKMVKEFVLLLMLLVKLDTHPVRLMMRTLTVMHVHQDTQTLWEFVF